LAYSLLSPACSDKYQANPNVQDIIHGDIKPHNVLVFSRSQQLIGDYCGDATNYVAKVADFGYSTCMGAAENTSSSEQVSLPWSPPWNAPEIHRDNYILPFSEAKLSDVFSLGMLCLWLLFQNENLSKPAGSVQGEYDWLRALKEDGKMKSFARDRIHGDQGLDISRKPAIKEFFELTLSAESSRRTGDLHYLLRLLGQDTDKTEEGLHIPVVSEPEHQLIVKEPLFEVMTSKK
jgi:serine/threonine protein kinase